MAIVFFYAVLGGMKGITYTQNESLSTNKKKIVVLDIPLYLENKMYKSIDVIIFLITIKKDVDKKLKKRKQILKTIVSPMTHLRNLVAALILKLMRK